MWKYALMVSYRGSAYCGWQRQKRSLDKENPSVQDRIEKAVAQMTHEEVAVVGSGRTDSGVHAVGQVAHFILREKKWDREILQKGLNGILPADIRILAVQSVSLSFHAQKSAEKKQYSYYFQQGACALPHLEPFSWWIRKTLDVKAMSTALNTLVGEHDYKAFQASGARPGPTVRRILEAEVTFEEIPFPLNGVWVPPGEPSFGLIRVRLLGTGFLKQMVRGIAGTLLQIGEGRRPAACMAEILASQDRSAVGPTAPARALWLERVWYPENLTFVGG